MKIASKITLSFLSVAVILTTVTSLVFYLIDKNNLEKQIDARLENIVLSRERHIETYLQMLKTSIGQLSKSVVLEDFLHKPQSKEAFAIAAKRLKRTKEANPAISEFLLMDTTGRVIVASREASIGTDKSKDSLFVAGQKQAFIKDAHYSEELKKGLLAVSTPFLDSQTNELLGVLAARVELGELDKIVTETAGLGKTGEIYLVNKYGFMITPSRFLKDTFLKQKVDTENYRECLLRSNPEYNPALEKEILISPNYRGDMVLGAHAYIPEMQWSLLAEIATPEALAPLAQIYYLLIIILIVVPLVAWLLGAYLSMLITEPIHKLHKGVEVIGSGNLDYKVGTSARDEIGQLSRAFDEMTADLKLTTTSIDILNQEIAEREKAEDELRKVTDELKKLDQLKSDFVSIVSHELRTPLSITKEGISLVLDGIPGKVNTKQNNLLTIARDNVDRLARIINGLLDISKIEAGKVEIKKELVNFAEFIRSAAHTFDLKAKEKGLAIKTDIAQDEMNTYADIDKITQVLTNLIGNALKFTDKGEIRISARELDKEIECSVTDTGIGISPEDLPRVFEKFQQFGRTSGPGEKGTGLGLSIAKGIIELHKGKIRVESEPGKGSKFTFVIPKYTSEEMFKESIETGIKEAARKDSSASLLLVSIVNFEELKQKFPLDRIRAMVKGIEEVIKNTLRLKGDIVARDTGEVIVLLMDCSKDNALIVKSRLEQALTEYLAQQKLSGVIKLRLGNATYPEEAKDNTELISKAKSGGVNG